MLYFGLFRRSTRKGPLRTTKIDSTSLQFKSTFPNLVYDILTWYDLIDIIQTEKETRTVICSLCACLRNKGSPDLDLQLRIRIIGR